MTTKRSALSLATAFLPILALAQQAQSHAPISSVIEKPAWLSDLSLCVRENYDDNVFLQGVTPLLTADYSMGNVINRYDMQYTVSAGLNYAINSHASLGLGYSLDLGRSAENFPNNVPEDQYDRQLVSLSALFKF